MARIAGVNIPLNKRVEIGLTYIYGVGRSTSNQLLAELGISPDTYVRDLTEDEIARLRDQIDREYMVKVPWEGAGRMPASNTFLVEGNPWHNPTLPQPPEFDLKKSREILKAAGYSWAGDGRLVFPPPSDEKFRERVTKVSKDGYKWGGLKMLPKA